MYTNLLKFIPAIIIAIFQTQLVWKTLPPQDSKDTVLNNSYTNLHLILFVFVKYVLYSLFIIQLFFEIFIITSNRNVESLFIVVGYLFIVYGFLSSLIALKNLGESWSNMMFFRIKTKQKLIKNGIYKMVRHPIYGSVVLEIVGFQLIANSYMFLFLGMVLIILFNYQIKNEEDLLLKHYKNEYLAYKMSTKRYFPFIY